MKKTGHKERIKKEKEIALLAAGIGAVEGYLAPTIQNIHSILIIAMIVATIKLIENLAKRKLDSKKLAHIFGNGFWPYLTTFMAVWAIIINL